jgi:hypothetical protein
VELRTQNILNKTTAISKNLNTMMTSSSALMMDTNRMNSTHNPLLITIHTKHTMEEELKTHMIIAIGNRITRELNQKEFFLLGINNKMYTTNKKTRRTNTVGTIVRSHTQNSMRYRLNRRMIIARWKTIKGMRRTIGAIWGEWLINNRTINSIKLSI